MFNVNKICQIIRFVTKFDIMNEDLLNYLNSVRRDFAGKPFNEETVNHNPVEQFQVWIEEAINAQLVDPYAMSISTVNENGQPSTRIVYLRGMKDDGFIFYTNYNSNKGKALAVNNKVALNFLWRELERQVRIEGEGVKGSEAESDQYFAQRPRESQIGAWASNQSYTIKNREELESKVVFYTEKFKDSNVPRPPHWGGRPPFRLQRSVRRHCQLISYG